MTLQWPVTLPWSPGGFQQLVARHRAGGDHCGCSCPRAGGFGGAGPCGCRDPSCLAAPRGGPVRVEVVGEDILAAWCTSLSLQWLHV